MKTIGQANSTARPKAVLEQQTRKMGTPVPVEADDGKADKEGEKK